MFSCLLCLLLLLLAQTKEAVAAYRLVGILLAERNKNATRKTSSHIYGTTFDISRLEFHRNCDSTDVQYLVIRRILEQTVREIRKEKCCLVMKENKQLCLHITVIQ